MFISDLYLQFAHNRYFSCFSGLQSIFIFIPFRRINWNFSLFLTWWLLSRLLGIFTRRVVFFFFYFYSSALSKVVFITFNRFLKSLALSGIVVCIEGLLFSCLLSCLIDHIRRSDLWKGWMFCSGGLVDDRFLSWKGGTWKLRGSFPTLSLERDFLRSSLGRL